MDELLSHWDTLLWALAGKVVGFCLTLLAAAWRNTLQLLAVMAGWVNALAARLAQLPPWLTVSVAGVLVLATVCYLLRQRLYDRILIYHLVWLRRQGFSRQRLLVRRGAVRETVQAMARRVPLPQRFLGLAVYEVHPDRYVVAYDMVDKVAREVRFYRRDRRDGLMNMGRDVTAYMRRSRRLLHADSELRGLFAVLDAFDPLFAQCRPLLPGEIRNGEFRRDHVREAAAS